MKPFTKKAARSWAAQSRSYANSTTVRGGFHREYEKPDAAQYYSRVIQNLKRPNAEGWALGLCPFHDDKNPSLSVNLTNGAFKCFSAACDAHGSNVIAFHAKLYFYDDWYAARRDLVGGNWR